MIQWFFRHPFLGIAAILVAAVVLRDGPIAMIYRTIDLFVSIVVAPFGV